jgi:uncharacterized protein (TIGR00730 family)
MKRICVYCGTSPGARSEYSAAARQLGQTLARRNIELVYGGGNVGLMGEIARAVVETGGNVIGVIPRDLAEKEVAFKELADLRIVNNMHERKALMVKLADSFIALPGGFGTFEEFFEVVTWTQLGFQQKPCGLLNVGQYYTKLVEFLDHAVAEQFMHPECRSIVLVDEDIDALLDKLETYEPSKIDKVEIAKSLSKKMPDDLSSNHVDKR